MTLITLLAVMLVYHLILYVSLNEMSKNPNMFAYPMDVTDPNATQETFNKITHLFISNLIYIYYINTFVEIATINNIIKYEISIFIKISII